MVQTPESAVEVVFESKRFTRLAWPGDGSICGQTMVQVTGPVVQNGLGRDSQTGRVRVAPPRATAVGPIKNKKRAEAALGGPSGITVPEACAEFGKWGVPDLRDSAFVDTELPGNVTVLRRDGPTFKR
jgi:hypothetical protein